MQFPLSFWDFSLWLAATAMILLMTTGLISPSYEKMNLMVERKKLRNVSMIISILFLATVVIRIYEIVSTF